MNFSRTSFAKTTVLSLSLLLMQFAQVLPLQAKVLFGGVKHSESLPAIHFSQPMQGQVSQQNMGQPVQGQVSQENVVQPVPMPVPQPVPVPVPQAQPNMQTGQAQADTIRIPKIPKLVLPAPRLQWFMIPNWLAGKWSKKGDLTISNTDLRTGRVKPANVWTDDKMTVTWGYQVDSTGAIWHANLLPSWRDSYSNGKHVRFLTTSLNCEKVDAQKLVTRSHYVVTETTQGHVMQSFQQESVNLYTLDQDGTVKNMSSNRVFTNAGQAVRDGQLSAKFTKVAEFQPCSEERGLDMATSFKKFLMENGMAQRVPK